MLTPSHSIVRVVADQPTTRYHHDGAGETNHLCTFFRDVARITKYMSPKKPGHSPKKPSAIPGGSPAQKPSAIPAEIPVGLALGMPPGPAMGLPLGRALGIVDDVHAIGGQP